MKRIAVACCLVLAVLLCSACPGPEPRPTPGYSEKDSGQAVQLAVGGSFNVVVEDNPSTGYAWEVAVIDPAVLREAGRSSVRPASSSPPMVGAPQQLTLAFQGVAPGHTALKLVQRQPWMQAVPPVRTIKLDVTVN